MDTLPGHHKTFVLQPTAAELEKELPVKGAKGSNAKHFTPYHEIEFVTMSTLVRAFVGLCVQASFSL